MEHLISKYAVAMPFLHRKAFFDLAAYEMIKIYSIAEKYFETIFGITSFDNLKNDLKNKHQ